MRVVSAKFLGLAAMIAWLVSPAYAQAPSFSLTPPTVSKTQEEKDAEAVRDKAYKESLKKIPNAAPADPWGIARGADTPKNADKSADKTSAPAKPRTKAGSTAN